MTRKSSFTEPTTIGLIGCGNTGRGFYGILNSTTNFILTEMQRSRSFHDSLERARRLGTTETDSSYDIDGRDAATKTGATGQRLTRWESSSGRDRTEGDWRYSSGGLGSSL